MVQGHRRRTGLGGVLPRNPDVSRDLLPEAACRQSRGPSGGLHSRQPWGASPRTIEERLKRLLLLTGKLRPEPTGLAVWPAAR